MSVSNVFHDDMCGSELFSEINTGNFNSLKFASEGCDESVASFEVDLKRSSITQESEVTSTITPSESGGDDQQSDTFTYETTYTCFFNKTFNYRATADKISFSNDMQVRYGWNLYADEYAEREDSGHGVAAVELEATDLPLLFLRDYPSELASNELVDERTFEEGVSFGGTLTARMLNPFSAVLDVTTELQVEGPLADGQLY